MSHNEAYDPIGDDDATILARSSLSFGVSNGAP